MTAEYKLLYGWWEDHKKKHSTSKKEYYNSIPVHVCKECHSLYILTDDELGDYCGECGNTETEEMKYSEWERLYRFTKIQTKL